jgi:hypothetical protein
MMRLASLREKTTIQSFDPETRISTRDAKRPRIRFRTLEKILVGGQVSDLSRLMVNNRVVGPDRRRLDCAVEIREDVAIRKVALFTSGFF